MASGPIWLGSLWGHRERQLFKDVLVQGGGHTIFRFCDEKPRS